MAADGDIRDKIYGMSGSAREVLRQLFLNGPTEDGDVASKAGRSELVGLGHAFRWNGFQSLTEAGVKFAVESMLLDREKEKRDRDRRAAK